MENHPLATAATPPPPYHPTARIARTALTTAMDEAKALLPRTVMTAQWMAAKHSPASWRATEAWFRNQSACDPQILATLTDLALMSEALANLSTMLTEQGPMGSLKVAKKNRVEL